MNDYQYETLDPVDWKEMRALAHRMVDDAVYMMARNVAQAHYLGKLIEAHPQLELMAPIGLDIVCFRYNPGGLDDEALNELNRAVLIELQERGIAAPSSTTLAGGYCLRVAIANHRSTTADFDLLVKSVEQLGKVIHGGA